MLLLNLRQTADNHNALRRVCFGLFEVDLLACQLRRNGRRIQLQNQPFEVLAALLEHAGNVVTREDLQARLWHADTFVDFDHSLNVAINKLRNALGDSADTPSFVETVPRRGYQFIAPVEKFKCSGGKLWQAPAPVEIGRLRRQRLLLALVLAVALVLSVMGWSRSSAPPPGPGLVNSFATGRELPLHP